MSIIGPAGLAELMSDVKYEGAVNGEDIGERVKLSSKDQIPSQEDKG
jgi:hypothetical protein